MGQITSNPGFTKGRADPPTFDAHLGFPEGRQKRVMIATEEEMISAKIPHKRRDYCAHLLIQFRACKQNVWPRAYKCKHEMHEYEECQYNDHILRMKEYEREKRLQKLHERKAARASSQG